MSAPRVDPELVHVRRLAEELAHKRKERPTSLHLLAALAARPCLAADLLRERNLDADGVLARAGSLRDAKVEPIARALSRAKEVAERTSSAQLGPVHVLLALLHERSTEPHRVIEAAGIDVARLRAAAMQLALGFVGPRRVPSRQAAVEAPKPAPTAPGRPTTFRATAVSTAPTPSPRRALGTRVPLLPPSPRVAPPRSAGAATAVSHVDRPPPARVATTAPRHPHVRPQRAPTAREGEPATPLEARFALDPKHFPVLAGLGRNLTLSAARGEIERVVARDAEIDRVLDVLSKRRANNPLLVGPPGVGKTAVVRGVAARIAEGPPGVDDRVVLEIGVADLVGGTAVRGALAERVAAIRAEVRASAGRVVLCIDDAQRVFAGDLGDEAVGELTKALARGELPCVATATAESAQKMFVAEPGLARAFAPIEIDEPSREETMLVLKEATPALASHHGVVYDDAALAASIAWSSRYLPGPAQPDKSLSVLDLAGARARRRKAQGVAPEGVAEVVAELADVPVERMLESDGERMLALESIFAERVVGHDEALSRIARILRRNAAGLRGRRPIGTFLLLGPTGVGKTETAKAIAEALFHSPDAMTRLDLAEFSEAHAVARLVGAPPGYVGHEAGGQLTEAVRRRPYQVILLDEIEKAHRDVLVAFLGVFDEGRLTDGRGRTVDFTNTVLVMTSNLGAAELRAKGSRGIGFARAADDEGARVRDVVTNAAKSALPPELYNRIDEVIAFAPLGRADVANVARALLGKLADALAAEHDLALEIEDAAIDVLLDAGGFDPELGARPMRRTIARLVEAPLAEMILRGELSDGDTVLLGADDGAIVIDAVKRAPGGSRVA